LHRRRKALLTTSQDVQQRLDRFGRSYARITQEVGRVIVGHEEVLEANGFEAWCLHVTDRSDLAPPGAGDLVLEDAETGETLGVHLSPEVRERLALEAAQFGAEVRSWCLARGIGYAEAPTHVPVDTLVLEVLRRGGLVR